MPNEYTPYTESNGEGKNMAEAAIVVGEIESEDFIPYTQKTLEGKKLAMPIILIIPSGAKGFPTREEMGKAIADKLASTFVREFPAIAGIGKDIIADGSAPTATGADGDYYFTLAFDAEWKIIVWEHTGGAWEISTVYPPIPAQNFRWVGIKNAAGNIDGYYIVLGEQTAESLPEWELLGPGLEDYYKKQEVDEKFAAKTAVESAQSAADTALGAAGGAQSAASNAQSTANTALTTAGNAAAAANNAQNTADTALGAAASAQSTASTAQSTANTALSSANNAQTAATNAAATASAAGLTADKALKSAGRIITKRFTPTVGQDWITLYSTAEGDFYLRCDGFAMSNNQDGYNIDVKFVKRNTQGWVTLRWLSSTTLNASQVRHGGVSVEAAPNLDVGLAMGVEYWQNPFFLQLMGVTGTLWQKIDIYYNYAGHGVVVITEIS